MSDLITASQLNRHCGHARVLSKTRVRSRRTQAAMDTGTAFHAAVEALYAGRMTGPLSEEVAGWLRDLAATWEPPAGAEFEIPLGLGTTGRHVAVDEPSPHAYVAKGDEPLLTAGRADCVWMEGNTIALVDFKTGRFEVEHPRTNLQLWALALAASDRLGGNAIRTGLYYARRPAPTRWVWSDRIPVDSAAAADRWADVATAATIGPEPRVGWWCKRCWERGGCDAYKASMSAV